MRTEWRGEPDRCATVHLVRSLKAASPKKLLHATQAPRGLREAYLAALRVQGRLFPRPRSAPEVDDRARILALTPTYLPSHRRGAEVTLHALLVELKARGHLVRVIVDAGGPAGTVDGIEVFSGDRRAIAEHCRWSDVLVAQLGARDLAMRHAARWKLPVAYYVHIGGTPRKMLAGSPDLTLFSSDAIRSQQPWIRRSLVMHPPIYEPDYLVEPGNAITLVNLTEPKGASVLYALAKRLPSRSFLGVMGWGPQVLPDPIPSNLTLIGPVENMREVYRLTRILLVPSVYESYGRVALEAAVSGIPTIASPTAGVQEALGEAALWADREQLNTWVDQIQMLDDPDAYETQSRLVRTRFEQLDPSTEIDALERELLRLARGEST